MRHWAFADRMAALPGVGQHLGVDQKATGPRQQVGQHFASEDFQSAIAVPDASAEQRPYQEVVSAGEKAAKPRVLPVESIADRDWVGRRIVSQECQVGKIELAISVRERDQRKAGGLESAPQCRAVATILAMRDEANFRHARGADFGLRRIVAAIVDEQDLKLREVQPERFGGVPQRGADAGGLVVGGNDHRDGRAGRVHAVGPQVKSEMPKPTSPPGPLSETERG